MTRFSESFVTFAFYNAAIIGNVLSVKSLFLVNQWCYKQAVEKAGDNSKVEFTPNYPSLTQLLCDYRSTHTPVLLSQEDANKKNSSETMLEWARKLDEHNLGPYIGVG